MSKITLKILHRTPYEMPDLTNYSSNLDMLISQTESLLKRKVSQLKRKKVSRQVKENYLRSIVDMIVAQEKSRYERLCSIDQSMVLESEMKMQADRTSLQNYSDQINQEIKGLTTELEGLINLYEKHNPLHNGQLEHESIKSSNTD